MSRGLRLRDPHHPLPGRRARRAHRARPVSPQARPFTAMQYSGAVLAAWIVAWLVLGFASCRTSRSSRPAGSLRSVQAALDRRVRDRGRRPAHRPADGPAARAAALELPRAARDAGCRSAISICASAWAMVGLTVAKRARPDRRGRGDRASSGGRAAEDGDGAQGRAAHRRRHQRDHRRPDRRDRRVGLHLRHARGPALRPRGAPAHRRQLRHAAPQPRPARPRDPGPDAEGRARRRSRSSRTTSRDIDRGRRQARRARQARQPGDPDQRLQPEPRRRAAGRAGPQHQLAGQRGEAGPAAGRGPAGPGDPGGQGGGPGRRLPGRRHDDRGRGRRPAHRPRARRRGHPGPPDRGRADDLRPAPATSRRDRGDAPDGVASPRAVVAFDAIVVAAGASRRMDGQDKLAGTDRRTGRCSPGRSPRSRPRRGSAGSSSRRRRRAGRDRRGGLAAGRRSSTSWPAGDAARNRSRPAFEALDAPRTTG